MAEDLGYQRYVEDDEGAFVDRHTNHPGAIRMSMLPGYETENVKGLLKAFYCSDCHMPVLSSELSGYDIYSHIFRRDTPDNLGGKKVPNACLNCHTEENKKWVKKWLKTWSNDREMREKD